MYLPGEAESSATRPGSASQVERAAVPLRVNVPVYVAPWFQRGFSHRSLSHWVITCTDAWCMSSTTP